MRKFDTNDCKFATMPAQKKAAPLIFTLSLFLAFSHTLPAQESAAPRQSPPPGSASSDTWTIHADSIDPAHYFGVTVANGMIGLVSSTDPFRAKDIVLNGAFDLYGRGRVSNILKTFNFVNLNLDIDGNRIGKFSQVSLLHQILDMKNACLTTTFDYQDKATVSYTWYSLRQLPYTALVDVSITAHKDIQIIPASVMEAPDMLRDVE